MGESLLIKIMTTKKFANKHHYMQRALDNCFGSKQRNPTLHQKKNINRCAAKLLQFYKTVKIMFIMATFNFIYEILKIILNASRNVLISSDLFEKPVVFG